MIAFAKEKDALNMTLSSCINSTNALLCNYCTKIFVIVVNTWVCRRSVDNKAAILSYPILSYPSYCTTLGDAGGGGCGTQRSWSPPRGPTPYPIIYYFYQIRYPFHLSSLENWYPFHIPRKNTLSLFTTFKRTVAWMNHYKYQQGFLAFSQPNARLVC